MWRVGGGSGRVGAGGGRVSSACVRAGAGEGPRAPPGRESDWTGRGRPGRAAVTQRGSGPNQRTASPRPVPPPAGRFSSQGSRVRQKGPPPQALDGFPGGGRGGGARPPKAARKRAERSSAGCPPRPPPPSLVSPERGPKSTRPRHSPPPSTAWAAGSLWGGCGGQSGLWGQQSPWPRSGAAGRGGGTALSAARSARQPARETPSAEG